MKDGQAEREEIERLDALEAAEEDAEGAESSKVVLQMIQAKILPMLLVISI